MNFVWHTILVLFLSNGFLLSCRFGHFKLPGMLECAPWLRCDHLAQMPIGSLLGYGAVKKIYSSQWKSWPVALVFLHNEEYREDFLSGINNLKILSMFPNITVQLIGSCLSSFVYVTELMPFRDSSNFVAFVQQVKFSPSINPIIFRLRFCEKYASIIHVLHSFPLGPLTMCDSTTLKSTLEQLLLSSDERLLVLGDTDALPMLVLSDQLTIWSHCNVRFSKQQTGLNVSSSKSCYNYMGDLRWLKICLSSKIFKECQFKILTLAKMFSQKSLIEAIEEITVNYERVQCGSKLLSGEFVAPEQRSYMNRNVNYSISDSLNVPYDHRSDLYKLPSVCMFFLGGVELPEHLNKRLSSFHEKCSKTDPRYRPTAGEAVEFYSMMLKNLAD